MIRTLFPLLLLLPTIVFAADGETSAEELLQRIEGSDPPFILDVRTSAEYVSGHVPKAVNIPHDKVESRLAELDGQREREIVVYCKSGRRAGMAMEVLSQAGFRVSHLDGDMNGWVAAGHTQSKPGSD